MLREGDSEKLRDLPMVNQGVKTTAATTSDLTTQRKRTSQLPIPLVKPPLFFSPSGCKCGDVFGSSTTFSPQLPSLMSRSWQDPSGLSFPHCSSCHNWDSDKDSSGPSGSDQSWTVQRRGWILRNDTRG